MIKGQIAKMKENNMSATRKKKYKHCRYGCQPIWRQMNKAYGNKRHSGECGCTNQVHGKSVQGQAQVFQPVLFPVYSRSRKEK